MRKMWMFIAGSVFAACSTSPQHENPAQSPTPTSANTDSLLSVFVSAWNASDSAAIMNTLAPDAIVMNDSLIHKGTQEIAMRWVSGGVKVLSNVNVSSLVHGADGSVAYDAGTYSLDLSIPNGPKLKERGNYSMAWSRQTDGSWKLTLVHIEDITRMPDVAP